MSRVRDMLIMGQQSSSLPYIELEAIESTGTQWINTNIVDYDNEMKMSLTFTLNTTGTQYISAAQTSNTTNGTIGIYCYDNLIRTYKRDTTYTAKTATAMLELEYDVEITQTGASINGEYSDYTTVSNSNCAYPFGLFCSIRGGNATVPASITLSQYSLEKYIGDDLGVKMDLIPSQLTSDIPSTLSSKGVEHYSGEVGMWDKVTNTFFGNSGTGEFIAHYKS